MALLDNVKASLGSWTREPCFIELTPRRTPKPLYADQLLGNIEAMKRDLRTWGIVKGSPVPLFLHNSIDFVIAFLALMDLGAIPVLANMDFRRLELAEIFADVRPPAVLAEKNHLGYLQSHLGGCTVISHDGGEFKVIGHRENAGHDGEIDEEIASINYTYRGCGYPLGALIPPCLLYTSPSPRD